MSGSVAYTNVIVQISSMAGVLFHLVALQQKRRTCSLGQPHVLQAVKMHSDMHQQAPGAQSTPCRSEPKQVCCNKQSSITTFQIIGVATLRAVKSTAAQAPEGQGHTDVPYVPSPSATGAARWFSPPEGCDQYDRSASRA